MMSEETTILCTQSAPEVPKQREKWEDSAPYKQEAEGSSPPPPTNKSTTYLDQYRAKTAEQRAKMRDFVHLLCTSQLKDFSLQFQDAAGHPGLTAHIEAVKPAIPASDARYTGLVIPIVQTPAPEAR